jgi:hypothetical protein
MSRPSQVELRRSVKKMKNCREELLMMENFSRIVADCKTKGSKSLDTFWLRVSMQTQVIVYFFRVSCHGRYDNPVLCCCVTKLVLDACVESMHNNGKKIAVKPFPALHCAI